MLAPEPVSFAVGPAGTACSGFLWLFGLRAGRNGRSSPPVDLVGRSVRTSRGGAQDSVFRSPPLLGWPLSLATVNAYRLFTLEKGAKGGACENLHPPIPLP